MPVFENRGSYLYIESLEPYSLRRFLTTIRRIGQYCKHKTLDKVLINARNLQDDISNLDRYEIGKEIAKAIGPKIMVAVVANSNIINYMTEHSAVNRGAKLQMFTDTQKAMEWLGVKE